MAGELRLLEYTEFKYCHVPPCPGWPKYQWWLLRSSAHWGPIGFVIGLRSVSARLPRKGERLPDGR